MKQFEWTSYRDSRLRPCSTLRYVVQPAYRAEPFASIQSRLAGDSMSRLSCFFATTLVGCVLSASPFSHAQSSYDSVDPLIGTTGDGNTFPGASLPFGMIQWSPDTGRDGWYFY